MLFSCYSPSGQNALAELSERGVLKVGTLYGSTTYYNGPAGPMGFEYELLENFADYLGVELQVYPFFSYQSARQHLIEGELDIIATGDVIDYNDTSLFDYGPAYQRVDQHLVFRNGTANPDTLEEIDAPMVVVSGSSQAALLQSRLGAPDQQRWYATDDKDAEELLQRVADGELDYTLADSNRIALQRRRFPQLLVGKTLRADEPVAWAVRPQRDDSIRAAMVAFFGQAREAGLFSILEDKYFGHVRQFDFVDTRAFISAINSVLPAYRPWFKEYAGDLDWRLVAAMSYQESHWKPNATSPTGVRGMMMLTRDTAKDWDVANRTDPQESIRGGAQYFASLKSRIPARIDDPDRTWMALAAYNIGLGHLEDARVLTQRQGGNPDLWVDVKRRLPQLRQKKYYRQTKFGFARGDEARQYVENIRRYYDTLVWMDENRTSS
ncbi:membrane-bound lytic murein transglycosylase F [Alteromonas halophila]|uniref:Membrane-bound lytic murein transglycosylase F n=1 Tax=Alteromonas halophila TaxID=516698 RepID=A0A918MUB1_9ALTE|nr:membrane-bound lytic murein transglycosylase F [Alteromonas halophila]